MARPEIAMLIGEFEDEPDFRHRPPDTQHHDQSACVQSTFIKDVQSMVNVMEDFGNPFEAESQDLLVLDTKEIAPPAAIDALRRAHEVGKLNFDNFVRERLVERTKPLEDATNQHKLKIFDQPPKVPGKRKPGQVTKERRESLLSVVYRVPELRWEPGRSLQT